MTRCEGQFASLGLVLFLLLVAPPVRDSLERSMTTHVAVQLPGLAIAGWFLGVSLRRWAANVSRMFNVNGVCGLVTSLFAAAIWMLPRALDEAIADPHTEIAKFLTIPLLVGLPLGLSWPCLNPIVRGLLKASLISKLAVLGWIYAAAPVRLCTSYLQDDQARLGEILYFLAMALAIAWSVPWFVADAGAAERSLRQSLSEPNRG